MSSDLFLITELQKQNVRVEIIDDEPSLFSVNNKVIVVFSEDRKEERQIQACLLEILISYSDTFLIAYAIQNKNGACVIRVELSDGFVSSHEKGR